VTATLSHSTGVAATWAGLPVPEETQLTQDQYNTVMLLYCIPACCFGLKQIENFFIVILRFDFDFTGIVLKGQ
jgi:hypothetical protein